MICDFVQGCTEAALGMAFGVQQYQEIQDAAAAQQAQYGEDYTGTPSSINPDTFDTNFDGSGSGEDRLVLCSAAEAYVKMFAAQKAQQLKLILGGSAAILALITLLVPGLGWILAAGVYVAIGAAVLVTGVTYGTAIAALEDEDALNAVSCCLNDSLLGLAVTEANWNAALTGCDFDADSYPEIVREFVVMSLAGNYLTFLNLMGTAKHAQDEGEPLTCSCILFAENVGIIAQCEDGAIETVEFEDGVDFTIDAYYDGTENYQVALKLPPGEWIVTLNNIIGTITPPVDMSQTAYAWIDETGTFHNVIWSIDNPLGFPADTLTKRGIYSTWCANQEWNAALFNAAPFSANFTVTAAP